MRGTDFDAILAVRGATKRRVTAAAASPRATRSIGSTRSASTPSRDGDLYGKLDA